MFMCVFFSCFVKPKANQCKVRDLNSFKNTLFLLVLTNLFQLYSRVSIEQHLEKTPQNTSSKKKKKFSQIFKSVLAEEVLDCSSALVLMNWNCASQLSCSADHIRWKRNSSSCPLDRAYGHHPQRFCSSRV